MEQPLKNQQQSMKGPQPQTQKRKRKLPSPKELVSHYESQGMNTEEASLKAIEDLQNVLFRMVTSKARNNKDDNSLKKLEVINARLVTIDMKLDSKPGYPQMLAIGTVSGALVQSVGSVLPRVGAVVSQIWNSVSRVTSNVGSSVDR